MATEKDQVDAMLLTVRGWLRENYPHSEYGVPLPENMVLEMHPAVYRQILQHSDPMTMSLGMDPTDWMAQRFAVKVKINPLLASHTFRLVTITEDIHIAGKVGG